MVRVFYPQIHTDYADFFWGEALLGFGNRQDAKGAFDFHEVSCVSWLGFFSHSDTEDTEIVLAVFGIFSHEEAHEVFLGAWIGVFNYGGTATQRFFGATIAAGHGSNVAGQPLLLRPRSGAQP